MTLRLLERSVKFTGFTGLLPITSEKTARKLRFKISKTRVIVSGVTALFSLATLVSQSWAYVKYDNDTLAQYLIYIYWCTMNGFSSMSAHILAIKNQKKIRNFCNRLSKQIEQISSLTETDTETNVKKFIISCNISVILLLSSDFVQFAYINIPEYIVMSLGMLAVLQLGVLHLIIASILNQLQESLENNLKYVLNPPKLWSFPAFDQIRREQIRKMVQRYCSAYRDLFELSQEFCATFATISLIFISHMFVMLIIASYSGLKDIDKDISGKESQTILMLIGWIIYALAAIILIIYPCVNASQQGSKLAETVYKFLARNFDDRINEQLIKFAMVLNHDRINFTPHNLFSYTYGLILSIAGSSISYMVILTQFDGKITTATNSTV